MINNKLKRMMAVCLLGVYVGTNVQAVDLSVRGVRYLNNEYKWIDYKVSKDAIESTNKKLKITENIKEMFTENVGRNNDNEPQMLRYLIEHNIVTRDGGFYAHKITTGENVAGDGEPTSNPNPDNKVDDDKIPSTGGNADKDNTNVSPDVNTGKPPNREDSGDNGGKKIEVEINKKPSNPSDDGHIDVEGNVSDKVNNEIDDKSTHDSNDIFLDIPTPNEDGGWISGSLTTDDPKLKEHLNNRMNKSSFLKGLYKSKYGAIDSRPIIFFLEPKRFIKGKERVIKRIPAKDYIPEGYNFEEQEPIPVITEHVNHSPACSLHASCNKDGSSVELNSKCNHDCEVEAVTNWIKPTKDNTFFKFADDLGVYISSDVYELYLSSLLDKGIISRDEIGNDKFLDEYKHNGSSSDLSLDGKGATKTVYTRWSNNVSPYYPGSSQPPTMCNLYPSSPLGQGYRITSPDGGTKFDEKKHERLTSLLAEKVDVCFFKDENMRYVDALKYVERVLRIEEKDLTQTEAQIIAYKYGTPYINLLDEDTKRTVLYLIAVGVLDLEEDNIMTKMYDVLTNAEAYELFYRITNKASRKDFSKIQLTDSDNFWIQKGYVENKINIVKDPKYTTPATLDVEVTDESIGEDASIVNTSSVNINKDSAHEFLEKIWNTLGVIIPSEKVYAVDHTGSKTAKKKGESWIDKIKDWWGNMVGKPYKPSLELPEVPLKPNKPTKPTNPPVDNADDNPINNNPDTPPSKGEGDTNPGKVDKPREDKEEPESKKDEKVFLVKKAFMTDIKGKFKDKEIQDLQDGDFNGLIKENKIEGYTSNIGPSQRRVITFKVKASSPVVAVAYVDSNIQIFTKKDYENVMRTVTRVSDENGSKFVDNYISGDEFKRGLSEIEVVEDKLLKNKKTGATAILLQDNKTAIVGNTVIKLKDKAVFNINKVTYYNLDVIKSLLTESYLSEIDPGMFFVSNTLKSERIVKVLSSTGSHIENVPVATFKGLDNKDKKKTTRDMFNTNLLTRGVSTLIRDYSTDKNGVKVYIKLLVDWSYVMPSDPSRLTTLAENPKLNLREANNFLYTRPSDPVLSEWWDSNIGMSNSLCNLIFGTSTTEYIKCGYMVPSIKLLVSDSALSQKEAQDIVFGKITFGADYAKTFLAGKPGNFLNVMFNKDKIGNVGEMAKARTYECLIGKAYANDSDSYDFNGRYVLRPSGTVFKDVQEDPRILYSDGVIRLKTRNDKNSTTDINGRYVTLNGTTYYCDGYAMNGEYYTLVAKEPLSGMVIKTHHNNVDGYSIGGKNSNLIEEFIKDKTSELVPGGSTLGAGLARTGIVPINDLPEFKGMNSVIANNKIDAILSNGSFYGIGLKYGMTNKIVKMDTIPSLAYAHPIIYVSRTKYGTDPSDGSKLIPQQNYPFVQMGNIMYSGIASGMIDAMKCKSLKNVSMSKLPQGSRVLIGDTNFTVNGGYLMSDAITNQPFVNEVNSNVKDIKQASAKLFTGLSLDYSGRPLQFIDYISDVGLGVLPINDAGNNTLIQIGDALYVKNNSAKQIYNSGMLINSACIKIKLDDCIKFRKIGNKSNYYTIVLATDVFSEGYLGDLPFFDETLSLTLNDDLYLNLRKVNFRPLSNFNKLHDEFNSMYEKLLEGDMVTVIRVILICVISYFILISWMCFMILRFGLGRAILESIRNPGKQISTIGVDLIKMFSFGLFDLDEDPQGYRVVLLNLVLFLLLYIVIDGFQSFII